MRGKFCRGSGALDTSNDLRASKRIPRCILHENLQSRMFAGEPGPGVE